MAFVSSAASVKDTVLFIYSLMALIAPLSCGKHAASYVCKDVLQSVDVVS